MDLLFDPKKFAPFAVGENFAIYNSDSFALLDCMEPESVDVVFADPPYFLSNGGITCHSGSMVKVDKGEWDQGSTLIEKHEFNRNWLRLAKKVMKDTATIWVSGTLHNIYSIGYAMEQEGFKILNNITWQKTNPPPNLACKCFTHSTETILWARKDLPKIKHYFNYNLMKKLNNDKQMKDVWTGTLTKPSEKYCGKHPTQKPLYLLERIIDASAREGDLILDPFCGSSTTGVAAISRGCRYIGVEQELQYANISKRRMEDAERIYIKSLTSD